MKFSKLGQTVMTAGLSLAMTLGLSACSRDYIAAYVYAPSASNGTIGAYAVDYQSGILTQISGSPFASQLTNPTRAIASPDGKSLYVVGGSQNSQVEAFSIGTDGKLYGLNTVNLASGATYPAGSAIDSTGKFLYVTYTYQNGYGPQSLGSGGVSIFPIDTTTGKLGTPTNLNLTPSVSGSIVNPIGITVTIPVSTTGNNVYVYITAQQSTPTAGITYEYQMNTTTGALTPLATPTISSGVNPSFVIAEPSSRYVYVADKTSNQIVGFQLASTGVLSTLSSSPFTTGLYPVSMTIDPRGKYLYAVNYNANTVSGFTINHIDGSLGGIAAVGSFSTSTGPNCVTVDPSVGNYLYTSNYLDNSISGAQLRSEDGTLTAVANTPFTGVTEPSCITSVANGSHADSYVYPK
ncbi:MAG: beta-propeller fold lactonase family protein [Acidobacteriaceae bacterium]|nr:beta-propeller fold lactonase family protein [Acidobacteriaceae bacterium]